jgi:hypothetical protein
MSKLLKWTFLVHAIVAAVLGAALLGAPGRVLTWLGFGPLDAFANFFSRLLGAAMLALAWTSFRGWTASKWSQVAIVVEGAVLFTVLGCVGLLRLGLSSHYGWLLWTTFGILAGFALLWIVSLVRGERAHS